MREYVPNYASVSQSLQNRKTLLLKSSPIVESVRRKFSSFTRVLDLTQAEKESFFAIQIPLFRSRSRVHFDIEKQLYENVDVSKEFEIEVMIYHIKDENNQTGLYPSRSNVQPILFLSRQLKSVEKNY